MKNKILILGGSSDIGIEVIKKLSKKNYKISAHYSKNKKSLINFKGLKLINLDINKVNEKNCYKIIQKYFNYDYDCLINLVGYIDNKGFENFDLKNITKSLRINTLFPLIIQQKIILGMKKRKYGRIINGSSIGVKFGGGKNTFNYSFAKHCMEFIPNSYKDWAKSNILINNIRIGVTNTKIHNNIKKNLSMKKRLNLIPAKRMAEPNEIANYITYLISEKNTYMTGQTITVSGGE